VLFGALILFLDGNTIEPSTVRGTHDEDVQFMRRIQGGLGAKNQSTLLEKILELRMICNKR